MKPPIKRPTLKALADLKPAKAPAGAFAKPSPRVSRQTKAKVLTPGEKAAFLASRPDLKPKG